MTVVRVIVAASLTLAALAACDGGTTLPVQLPVPATLDTAAYRDDVQPLMDISCASIDCHGQAERPLHLFSVTGIRAIDGVRTSDPVDRQDLTDVELTANMSSIISVGTYDMAHPETDLVVTKPLAVARGGTHHDGGELWPNTDDPGYRCLRDWLGGAAETSSSFTDECGLAVTLLGGVTPLPALAPPIDAGPPVDGGETGSSATWSTVYATVLLPFCGGCHGGHNGSGAWSMGDSATTTYASLVSVTARYCSAHARVLPGDSANSALYLTLAGTSCGSQMPPRWPLEASQMALVASWIDAGALDD